ncbi:MAG TPA: Uma2 family endonuclease [Enhygromyxa sp.]|nr:Uma2 family endonuclease [Enhygromyxa sp.]
MQAALRPRYTFAEYLEIERRSRDVKHEYVAGEIFAMAGGSVEHAGLANAFANLLFNHLRGGPCRTYGSDLQISIRAAEVATYADVAVLCDPIERDPESPAHVTNPRIIVEVLSPTTERYDREQKRLYYQHLASLREYVLIAQDRRRVEVWCRGEEGWTHSVHQAGESVPLRSIDYSLSVDELYAAAGVR